MAMPVVAFISGRSSPPGQSMGHAGAIAERGRGDCPSKVGALRGAGIRVAENIGEVVSALRDCLPPPDSSAGQDTAWDHSDLRGVQSLSVNPAPAPRRREVTLAGT